MRGLDLEPADHREEDVKAIVEAVVRDALRRAGAERDLAELPAVFERVYRAAERRLDGVVAGAVRSDGLPFDPSFAAGTMLATVVWAACSLLRARRLRASDEQRAALVERLAVQEGSVERVRRLEEGIDALLVAVDRLSRELAVRQSSAVRGEVGAGFPARSAVASSGTVASQGGTAPDLVLVVARHGPVGGGIFLLGYLLVGRDPRGAAVHLRCPPRLLHRDPGPYVARLLEAGGRPPDADRAVQLGIHLGQRLLPPELVARLGELATTGAMLQVVCDDPAIPWELLRWRPEGAAAGEPAAALAESFALAQWPLDRQPVLDFAVRRIAVVAPEDRHLEHQAREIDRLTVRAGAGEVVRLPATRRAVIDGLLDGGFDVVHFSGHAVADAEIPERSALLLDDRERLTPIDLAAVDGALLPRAPLVFLNACQSGRTGLSLTGFGGLAVAFLEAGAGAVVGTRWNVTDGGACSFADCFYEHFLDGTPIAEAVRRARCSLRLSSAAGATGLAYTVFAHPGARLRETTAGDA